MQIIYSGFDTISFALKGAAKPSTIMKLQLSKERAVDLQQDTAISFQDGALKGLITPTGMKGGYAYVLKFGGDLGHVIGLKKSINPNYWNLHVKIRALSLACYGWEKAVSRALSDLDAIGVDWHEISLNRIDYAMDFINAGITLNARNFIAHSRVKKTEHNLSKQAHSRGETCESITIGKMPSRQIIIYDKRCEAIEKRKPAWFEIWNLDPKDHTQTVHRVEIRLGKDQIIKSDMRTFEGFKMKVNAAMARATHVIRFIRPTNDQNRSRQPNHPLWDHVQVHVKEHVLKNPNYVDIARVKHVIREEKSLMYKKLVLGNMAGLSVCEGMSQEEIKDGMVKFVEDQFTDIEANEAHPFWKSRAKTEDKYVFLE